MIERDEVKRLLAALLQENPAIDLDDDEIDGIVDQASIYPHANVSLLCKRHSPWSGSHFRTSSSDLESSLQ